MNDSTNQNPILGDTETPEVINVQEPEPVPTAGFLDENPGEKSGMRLFCFMTVFAILLVFVILNLYGLYKTDDLKNLKMQDFSPLAFYSLILAIFGKLAQKLLENAKDIITALAAFKNGTSVPNQ